MNRRKEMTVPKKSAHGKEIPRSSNSLKVTVLQLSWIGDYLADVSVADHFRQLGRTMSERLKRNATFISNGSLVSASPDGKVTCDVWMAGRGSVGISLSSG